MFFFHFSCINTLRPRQNGRHFPDDNIKCIFLNENMSISINISLKLVPKSHINNIPALVQIMAWRRPGDKSLSEPMVVISLTHMCGTQPQWVNVVVSLRMTQHNTYMTPYISWRLLCRHVHYFENSLSQKTSSIVTCTFCRIFSMGCLYDVFSVWW